MFEKTLIHTWHVLCCLVTWSVTGNFTKTHSISAAVEMKYRDRKKGVPNKQKWLYIYLYAFVYVPRPAVKDRLH